jgi:hypothetical protein
MATTKPDEKYRELIDTICGLVAEYMEENCIAFEEGIFETMVDETVEKCEFQGITADDEESIKELLPFDPNPWLEYTRNVLSERKSHGNFS